MSIVYTIAVAFLCLQSSGDKLTEITARHWLNPHTIRVPDERTYVVLFFSTIQGKKETRRYVSQLDKMRKKRNVVVMGLSAESSRRVEKYVKEKQIRFLVGAESQAYRQFRIKKFPALVVLDPKQRASGAAGEIVPINDLEEYLGLPEEDANEPLVSTKFNSESSIEVLQQNARYNSDKYQRQRAIDMLRGRMNPKEFMSLCDELLASAESSTMRGHIAYNKHLADPSIKDKEPYLAPGILAGQARRKNPDAPEWQRVRDYEAIVDALSPEQLAADFFDNQVDASDEQSLLIRREIGNRFNHISETGSPDEKAVARDLLMQMIPGEPDAAVRLWLVGALWSTVSAGNTEVGDFIEEQLKTEPNIRSVRPLMETVLRCMRTGEGPCYAE